MKTINRLASFIKADHRYVYLVSCLRTLCTQFVRSRQWNKLVAVDGVLCTVATMAFYVLHPANIVIYKDPKAGVKGFEPLFTVLETVALPLNYTPI